MTARQTYALTLKEVEQFRKVVYFASRSSDNAIKIGVSGRLQIRLANLRNQHGEICLLGIIPAGYGTEKAIKRLFDADHLGEEWFRLTDQIEHFIIYDTIKVKLQKDYGGKLAIGDVSDKARCKAVLVNGHQRCTRKARIGRYCKLHHQHRRLAPAHAGESEK